MKNHRIYAYAPEKLYDIYDNPAKMQFHRMLTIFTYAREQKLTTPREPLLTIVRIELDRLFISSAYCDQWTLCWFMASNIEWNARWPGLALCAGQHNSSLNHLNQCQGKFAQLSLTATCIQQQNAHKRQGKKSSENRPNFSGRRPFNNIVPMSGWP